MNSDIPKLLEYMNSRHTNIRFTCESEANDSISFIGILITCIKFANNMYGYQTTVYRKPTNTSLLMNFNRFTAYHKAVKFVSFICNLVIVSFICHKMSSTSRSAFVFHVESISQ